MVLGIYREKVMPVKTDSNYFFSFYYTLLKYDKKEIKTSFQTHEQRVAVVCLCLSYINVGSLISGSFELDIPDKLFILRCNIWHPNVATFTHNPHKYSYFGKGIGNSLFTRNILFLFRHLSLFSNSRLVWMTMKRIWYCILNPLFSFCPSLNKMERPSILVIGICMQYK